MAIVFIGLGSNLGNRAGNIKDAIRLLEESGDIKALATSSIYESEPIGVLDQPNYLNRVLKIETSLEPHELLKTTQGIEAQLGRDPDTHFQPRPIDIDILLYDELDLESLELKIPHSRLKSRRFVLEPLLEIEPNAADPVSARPFSDFLKEVKSQKLRKMPNSDEV